MILSLLLASNFVFAQGTQKVEPPMTPKRWAPAPDRWRFGVGASYGLISKSSFSQVNESTSLNAVVVDLNFENALSLELDARQSAPNSWGFIGGLTYDQDRKVTGGKIVDTGSTISFPTSDPFKIQFIVFSGNVVYRWNEFYLPFGLNINIAKYTSPSTFSGTHSVNGGLGGQLGVGYYLTEHFTVEAQSRATTFKLNVSTNSNSTDYGTGFFSTLMLTGKYIFN